MAWRGAAWRSVVQRGAAWRGSAQQRLGSTPSFVQFQSLSLESWLQAFALGVFIIGCCEVLCVTAVEFLKFEMTLQKKKK
jgi:hypothetical protein